MLDTKPEIVFYNVYKVPEYLRNRDKRIIPFLSEQFNFNIFDKYEEFGLNDHNMVYDRTNVLPHWLNIKKDLHPMPQKDDSFNKSFFEIAEIRAKELLSLQKPINVLWSGGIDSTFILFILKHFANDPDQVRVYGTYNSIIESGDLFDRKIKNNFKYKIKVATSNAFNYKVDEDSIFVSGMCGNQLFGPTDNYFSNSNQAMFHHKFGTPDTIYESYEKNIDRKVLEFLQPLIDSSPKKLETVNDIRWYCIFNLDWYTAIYEHKTHVGPEVASKVYGFFDSIQFQEWAINTKEPFTKIKGNPNTHRWQMRQVLDELFGEKHYAWNKDKKISNFTRNDQSWLFLLSDLNNVYAD